MLKAGLTGSIAVGKTVVCDVFRELGCRVLDADLTAREVVKPGTDGLAKIVKEFGREMLLPDGSLDRKKLGALVFADEAKREKLNEIVHPLVSAEQDRWLSENEKSFPDSISIVDAALMIESGGYKRFDRLIVVWCEPDIQLRRLMNRDGIDAAAAAQRIAVQMPQVEKKKFADHLIDTSKGFEDARRQVSRVFHELTVFKDETCETTKGKPTPHE
ncbi:MAG: dephospho-CoA kinase [Blastocatellia bacterium]|nr:dephospho-CoA kinase [Blastocatellia bacterium]